MGCASPEKGAIKKITLEITVTMHLRHKLSELKLELEHLIDKLHDQQNRAEEQEKETCQTLLIDAISHLEDGLNRIEEAEFEA